MADLSQLQAALVNADKAGDTAAASAFASEIRRVQGVNKRQPDALDDPNMAANVPWYENAAAGAGKALTDLGRGAAQVFGGGPSEQEMAQIKKQDAPLMNTGAGVLGNVAGNVAATLPTLAIPGVNTYTGAAGLGAVMGAIQPTGEGESRGANAALGAGAGAAGQGVGNLLARAMRPVQSNLVPEAQRLANVARAENIPLDAAAATGSKPLQTMNAVFENLPFTAGPQAAKTMERQGAFTEAALKRAGISSREATPDVLAAQKTALGQQFETIAGKNALDFNGGLAYDLQQIADTASRRLPHQGATITNTVQDILAEAPKGLMDGTKYQGWRSELGRLARGNDSEAHYFGQLKKVLDKEFGAQVPAADAAAWKEASREYANLKTIMNAMGGSGNAAQVGNIAPTALAQALRQSVGTEGKALGRGDLNDLSRVGNLFVRDQVPNSGTAQRLFIQNLLTGGGGAIGLTGAGAGGAALTGHDPLAGAALGLGATGAGLAGPRLAQAIMISKGAQAYMTQQAGSAKAKALANALQNSGRTLGASLPAIYANE